MNRIFIYIILFFNVIKFAHAQGQGHIIIKGKVICDSQPVKFANITVKNRPIGTVSNEVGMFEFHIPDTLKNDTLLISCIGFFNLEKIIGKISADDSIFEMRERSVQLNEIVVLPKDKTAKEIISFAIDNFKQNYNKKQYYLEGFYREISQIDIKAKRIIEAAIHIQEYGIKKNNDKDKIKVFQLRKSDDQNEYNWWTRKMIKYLFGEQNSLYTTYNAFDIVNKINIKQKYKHIDFEYEEPSFIDSFLVYKIKFSFYTHNGNKLHYGYIYINVEDYAILKVEKYSKPTTSFLEPLLAPGYNYIDKIVRIYKKYDSKYYLSMIYTYGLNYEGEVIEKNKTPKKETYLLINKIITDKHDYEKIRKKDMEQKNIRLYDEDFEYHPDFWKNYNILLTNPIQQKVKKDLEKEKKLETQFQENSK